MFTTRSTCPRPAGKIPDPPTRRLDEKDDEPQRSSIDIAVSAASGEGIESLEQAILESLGMDDSASATPFSARERHLTCLKNAHTLLVNATDKFITTGAGSFEDLRDVHRSLSVITGRRVTGRNLFFLLYRKIDTLG